MGKLALVAGEGDLDVVIGKDVVLVHRLQGINAKVSVVAENSRYSDDVAFSSLQSAFSGHVCPCLVGKAVSTLLSVVSTDCIGQFFIREAQVAYLHVEGETHKLPAVGEEL